MKLLHLTFHYEYAEAIEAILDRHQISEFVRQRALEGGDCEGKHYGSQVFPGNVALVQAQVPPERLDALLDDLARFRSEKKAHAHLQALVLAVERRL